MQHINNGNSSLIESCGRATTRRHKRSPALGSWDILLPLFDELQEQDENEPSLKLALSNNANFDQHDDANKRAGELHHHHAASKHRRNHALTDFDCVVSQCFGNNNMDEQQETTNSPIHGQTDDDDGSHPLKPPSASTVPTRRSGGKRNLKRNRSPSHDLYCDQQEAAIMSAELVISHLQPEQDANDCWNSSGTTRKVPTSSSTIPHGKLPHAAFSSHHHLLPCSQQHHSSATMMINRTGSFVSFANPSSSNLMTVNE